MTNLICNNRGCGIRQKAKVFEAFIPFSLRNNSEISRYFLLVIDKCRNCGQKKILAVGMTHLGQFIEFGFLKQKKYESVENEIIRELESLPKVEVCQDKKGFYLLYYEKGIEKRCYSNFRNLTLGKTDLLQGLNMLNQNTYKHSEFVKCIEVADFAKIYDFKDDKGKSLGRNKIFKILRELRILDKKNVPYQSYISCFKILEKEYEQGDKVFRKIIVFITPEGEKYLVDRINNFLDFQDESTNKVMGKIRPITNVQQLNNIVQIDKNKCCSPLDFDKDQAIEYLNKLPEFLRNTKTAIALREKWGLND